MDEVDFQIIRILSKDARTPFKRIGKNLGIGTDTVFRRFKRLQEKGIILGSTIILSSTACGLKGLCGLFIKIKSGSSSSAVEDKIAQSGRIVFVHPEWGEYDFYVDVFYADFQEINNLIDTLRKIPEISVVDPMIYTLQEWSMPFVGFFEIEASSDWFEANEDSNKSAQE